MTMIGSVWYRYTDVLRYGNYGEPESAVFLSTYKVIAETPATVVLIEPYYAETQPSWAKRHRVLKDARKRFAYPTKALAWNSYQARNSWRVARLEAALRHAKSCRAYIALVKGLTT